jgi:hypothetical protein
MEPEGVLSCSQQLTTRHHFKQDQSCPFLALEPLKYYHFLYKYFSQEIFSVQTKRLNICTHFLFLLLNGSR